MKWFGYMGMFGYMGIFVLFNVKENSTFKVLSLQNQKKCTRFCEALKFFQLLYQIFNVKLAFFGRYLVLFHDLAFF